jgi:hypothetical protein
VLDAPLELELDDADELPPFELLELELEVVEELPLDDALVVDELPLDALFVDELDELLLETLVVADPPAPPLPTGPPV